MVSGINTGGIPPFSGFQGQEVSKDATRPAESAPAVPAGTEVDGISDLVASANTVPQHLMDLINDDLSADGAKQTAADIFSALRGSNLSIANVDPSTIPGLSPE